MATVLEDKPRTAMLSTNGLRLMTSDFVQWSVNVPSDLTEADVLAAMFWKHVAEKLRAKDIVRVFAEDGTWEIWLTVLKPEASGAIVSKLFSARHDDSAETVSDEFELKWIPALKFCIVRKADGARVRENLYPKADAMRALGEMRVR